MAKKKPKRYNKYLIFSALLLSPWLILRARLRKSPRAPERFLILPQLTRIGDIIATTPVLRAIKKKYPLSTITVLASSKASGVLTHNPHITLKLYQDETGFGLVRWIQKQKFDVGISFSGSPASVALLLLGVVPTRIKVCRQKRSLAEILTDWLATTRDTFPNHTGVVAFFLTMLRHVGIREDDVHKEVFSTKEIDEKISSFLQTHGVDTKKTIVGLSLTAGNKPKEWPLERFAELMEKINRASPTHFIVIGSPADRLYIEELRKKTSTAFVQASNFSLEETTGLMKKFSYFISANTGPMHIADALKIPTVVINGSVDPRELVPETAPAIVVTPYPEREPSIFAFKDNKEDHYAAEAMKAISVEDVFNAFEKLTRHQSTNKNE